MLSYGRVFNAMWKLSPRIVLIFLLGGAASAQAQTPAETRLVGELNQILRAPELAEAFAGVHVVSLKDGHTVFGYNADKLFNPASNMKILTTAAALWYLGPSYRFRTEVRRDPNLKNGVVEGNLYLRGQGDPMLTTEEFFGLVNDVAQQGFTTVRGDLIIDATFFDETVEGPGWEQEIGDHAYAAPVGPLTLNYGTFELRVVPGEAPGDLLRVYLWPPVPSIEVEVQGVTRGDGARGKIWVGTSEDGDKIRVTVRGSLSQDDETVLVRRRIKNPSRYAGEAFREMLKMRGVEIKGKVKLGRMPKNGRLVAARASKSLAEIVSTLNKYSNNVMAEQILKTLGAELVAVPGSWQNGSKVLGDFLVELGVADRTFVIGNGSGLNDINRVTPAQLTRVLAAIYQRFELSPEFVSSLAVAGSSGTITGRFGDTPARARLRAKTGSLIGVSALSGYVAAQSGDIFAFSVMMNDYPGRARAMWRIQDRIGVALAQFQGTETVAQSKELAPGVR